MDGLPDGILLGGSDTVVVGSSLGLDDKEGASDGVPPLGSNDKEGLLDGMLLGQSVTRVGPSLGLNDEGSPDGAPIGSNERDGLTEGSSLGRADGPLLGTDDKKVGKVDGSLLGADDRVGIGVAGTLRKLLSVGTMDGLAVGLAVPKKFEIDGMPEGPTDGLSEGIDEGLGLLDGSLDGPIDGCREGKLSMISANVFPSVSFPKTAANTTFSKSSNTVIFASIARIKSEYV
jgi:hypothetical protein